MQLYATKRRGDLQFTVSYTLGKVITNASGNGDNDAPEAAGDLVLREARRRSIDATRS